MAAQSTSELPGEGVYVVGRFVDARAGKPWTGRQGQEMSGGWEVTLLVGRNTRTIRYRSQEDAPAGLIAGELVQLAVYLAVRKGYLFMDGVSHALRAAA